MTPRDTPSRRLALRVLSGLACVLGLWALLLLAIGGFDVTVAGLRVRSNNPARVGAAAAVLALVYVALGGRVRMPVRSMADGVPHVFSIVAKHPAWVVAAIAVATVIVSVAYGARTAGGSDAYGYVSQAHLWMDGRLKVPQPWAAEVPWTEKIRSFAPLGYRPAPGADEWAIVPIYSPGVPIMLALAKIAAGDWGLYLLIPIFGALAVMATYRLGRALGSPWLGVGGAWLIATTPEALAVLMEPITDVPAMAMWTLSATALLGSGRMAMAAAGLLASAAILIRPNLAVLAGPMALWPLIRHLDGSASSFRSRFTDALIFSLCVVPGVAFIAGLNTYLYGAPFESGYGPTSYLYSWSRVLPNLPRYFGWYVEAHTPIAVLGMIAVALPLRRIWPTVPDLRFLPIMALFNVVVWVLYASYFEYDSWGFLRFLLPGWPILMMGTVTALTTIARGLAGRTVLASAVAASLVCALGAWQLDFTRREGMFNQRAPARHEIEIGALVAAHTQPNSVVLTIQRSGSLRYYAGRVTLRYDYLDPPTIDRDLAWLQSRGVFAYALLDTHEVEEFRRRFAGQAAVSALDGAALVYEPGALRLFNLTPGAVPAKPVIIATIPPERFDVVPPKPPPAIVFR